MPVFAKEDRPMVPGQCAEGVVMDVTESLPGYPVYTLKYLTPEGEPKLATCGEGDLRGANPTDADLKAQGDLAIEESRKRDEFIIAEVARQLAIEVDDFKARQRQRNRALPKPRMLIFKDKRKPARKKR